MNKITLPWDRWVVTDTIGKGSYGTVYKIERTIGTIKEQSAMKVISIPLNQKYVQNALSDGYSVDDINKMCSSDLDRVLNEYNLMKKLSGNSNIVSCEDVDVLPHKEGFGWDVFIRMELLTPLSLVLRNENLDLNEIRQIGIDLCKALVLCEKNNIVHRDIKPENIFKKDNGSYKLGDFGVAKTLDRTSFATSAGTERYMAPEILKREQYSKNVDVYSLGLVLYWLLNEKRMPFLEPGITPSAEESQKALHRRLSGEPLPEPKNGSQEFKRIVLKACAYDRTKRYASAFEMLNDLNRVAISDKDYAKNTNSTDQFSEEKTRGNSWTSTDGTFGEYATNSKVEDTIYENTVTGTALKRPRYFWLIPICLLAVILIVAIAVLLSQKTSVTNSSNESNSSYSSEAKSNNNTEDDASDNTTEFTSTKMFGSSGEAYSTSQYSDQANSSLRLAKDASGTWYAYMNDGSIAWNYSGFVSNEAGTWYVEDGKVAIDKSGTYIDGKGTKYILENGKLIE